MKAVVTHRHRSVSQCGWDFPEAVYLFLQLEKGPRPAQGHFLCQHTPVWRAHPPTSSLSMAGRSSVLWSK